MTRKIEDRAKIYLLKEFVHSRYRFVDKQKSDRGFDLWLIQSGRKPKKVELKATGAAYGRKSDLFDRLVFNAKIEKTLFESGGSVIARVFLGNAPIRVFIITNAVLNNGAKLRQVARYVIAGPKNYADSFGELK